jgi:twitching motility protein PilT
MAQKKPLPLAGRLAIQLKMLTREEVERGIAESASSGNPRLVQVFLQMGMLDRPQALKLQKAQKELIKKRRASKQNARTNGGATLGRIGQPAGGRASRTQSSVGRLDPESIHRAAAHAAETAAPMTAGEVEALHEAPPAAAASPAPELEIEFATPAPAPASPASAPTASAPASAVPGSAPAAPVSPAASEAPSAAPSAPRRAADEGGVSLELAVPEPGSEDRARLEVILSAGVERSASDIHLHAGGALKHRIHGELLVAEESVAPEAVERMVAAALTSEQRAALGHDGEIDFCFDLPGIGRFRGNAYRQHRGLDAVFRSIPSAPPTLEELGLPTDLEKYTHYHQGMVLVTGPAGCGKSSTMAALVDRINQSREEHILTVEDPIEVIHPSKRCLVNQRHAGRHTASFSRALRGALREDPDVIVIGELRDLETISLAMTAAETGHFVLASLHTANAVRTVNRMIGAFPSNEQDQVRAMLSESLKAVISQRLVPTADGQGRVPALELLVINRAIGNLIRDEKTIQIRSSMQTGKAHGMYLLEQSLNELVAAGRITRDVALSLAEEEKLITAGA